MRKNLVWIVKGLTLLLVIGHFTLTLIYVLPVNTIKLEHQAFLNNTIGAFFPQNWSLFAPNPIANNEELLVKCLSSESTVSGMAQVSSDGWENITRPLFDALQSNRLTPLGRVERIHSTAIRLYMNTVSGAQAWQKSCLKGVEEACKEYERITKAFTKEGKEKLIKIASAYCLGANENTKQIALRIRHAATVKWSERYVAKRQFDDIDVGVFPIDKNVLPVKFYR